MYLLIKYTFFTSSLFFIKNGLTVFRSTAYKVSPEIYKYRTELWIHPTTCFTGVQMSETSKKVYQPMNRGDREEQAFSSFSLKYGNTNASERWQVIC